MPSKITNTTVEFTNIAGQPDPAELIHALCGIVTAADRLQPLFNDREGFETQGNLALAGRILAAQLASRLA